jgi:hypothetical protein
MAVCATNYFICSEIAPFGAKTLRHLAMKEAEDIKG